MKKDSRYDLYTQLLEKVDGMYSAVLQRHQGNFSCKIGCYGCCSPGLTVCNVEAGYIKNWLSSNVGFSEKIRDPDKMMNDPRFCSFLDREGGCSIYEARPIICRSHGLPISFKDESASSNAQERRDVCPLNFKAVDLNDLEQADVMSIDKVNVLLSLINRSFDEARSDQREPLGAIINQD